MSGGDRKAGRRGIKPPLHWVPLWALQGVARVHYERVTGSGPRAGTCTLATWRAWARRGFVQRRGDESA